MTLIATRTADPYPTRNAGDPELIDRSEPTVWDSGMAGPIDPATLASHECKGFSLHRDLLSTAEVDTYRHELQRLAADEKLLDDERTVQDQDTGEVRAMYEVHETSELIAELIRDPRVLDRARQVLGSDVYLHQTRVDYLPGFHGKGSYWHSDFENWHAEDGMPAPRAVSMSIALTQHQPRGGELMAMPGSHRTFVPCSAADPGVPSEDHLTRLAAAYGIDRFTGAEGSVLMLDANVMQGSADNITPFPRANIFVVFNSVANTLVEPFAATSPRPTFLANREFAPVSR